jgi:hypothetical protein
VALLNGAPSWAGASAGSFSVGITLGVPGVVPGPVPPQNLQPGVCLSRSLSERTRASVEVTCAAGEYASIQAFHFGTNFGWDAAPAAGAGWTGSGTVTMRPLFDATRDGLGDPWWDGLVELRVSF